MRSIVTRTDVPRTPRHAGAQTRRTLVRPSTIRHRRASKLVVRAHTSTGGSLLAFRVHAPFATEGGRDAFHYPGRPHRRRGSRRRRRLGDDVGKQPNLLSIHYPEWRPPLSPQNLFRRTAQSSASSTGKLWLVPVFLLLRRALPCVAVERVVLEASKRKKCPSILDGQERICYRQRIL
jgi:hypothetical protein